MHAPRSSYFLLRDKMNGVLSFFLPSNPFLLLNIGNVLILHSEKASKQKKKKMKEAVELFFFPALGMGHLLSAVEIAELLMHRDHHISITIFILTPPFDLKITSFIQSQTPERRLKFVTLPLDESISIDPTNIPAPSMIPIDSFKPRVRECVKETIRSVRLGGFVIDMFSTAMIDVADEFGVPTYVFYTSDAAVLGFLLHMQKITLEGFRA